MSQNGEDDDVYNNSHRAFLQSFLSRATLTFEEARPILAAIKNAQGRKTPVRASSKHTADRYKHKMVAISNPPT